jgi:hypothetical protein
VKAFGRVASATIVLFAVTAAACRETPLPPVAQDRPRPRSPSVVAPTATPTAEPGFGLDQLEKLSDSIDSDGDGLVANRDNYPGMANPDQADSDRDGFGDPCDPGDNVLPRVTLAHPSPRQRFDEGTDIVLRADARDRDGRIVRVTFFANGALTGEAWETPYVAKWEHVAAGRYLLRAEAADDSNGTRLSSGVEITVTPLRKP